MKTLLILCIVTLVTCSGFCQNKKNKKSEIPKKTNTIELITSYKTPKEALNEIVKVLLQEGIEPEKIDSSAYFITTGTHGIESTDNKLMFVISEKSDTITIRITGKFIMNIEITIGGVTGKSSWNKISYQGMKGSPRQLSWNFMHKFTTLIPNKKINYITQ
ncbi:MULTISPECIES: hypothetical protein [Butyricimonas]|uniref:hypothetical protein n=1 Tax=Butyricimonas TaxID=574697 RepID=UPI0007FB4CDF|nr:MULTISPECIES: hypothetical protein [Butyricimonas]